MARHKKSDPRWRDEASSEVLAACLPHLALGDHVLVAGDASLLLRSALAAVCPRQSLWLRRAPSASMPAAGDVTLERNWPADGPYSAALVRLPRSKEELDMLLHAAAARVGPGGAILVYGANDEGIRSAAARMEPLLGRIDTIDQRAHCRVLCGHRPADIPGLKRTLADWRQVGRMEIAGVERPWVSYPGVFAKGGLDAGTRLLVAALTDRSACPERAPIALAEGARVLDFACGTGVIAAHVQRQWPEAILDMADWDALAVLAARENVPGASAHVAARLQDVAVSDGAGGRYDLIVSNPPIHDGKTEDYAVLTQLIAQAPARLAPRGALVIVVQGRVPVEEWLSAVFGFVETRAQDTRYRVWRASAPKARGPSDKTRQRPPRERR